MKFLKRISLLTLFFGCLIEINGQTSSNIDSLTQLLRETHDIEGKIEVCVNLSREYHTVDLIEAKKYAELGLQLSGTSDIDNYQGNLYRSLGDIAIKEDSMDLAEKYYLKASNYFKQGNDQRNQVMVLNVLGNIQFMRSQYTEALIYYLQAIEIAEKNDFKEFLAHLYHNIGAVYTETKSNYRDAVENYSIALKLFEDFHDSINMANVYNSLGETYFLMNDTAMSLTYYQKAKKIYILFDNLYGVAQSNIGIAEIMSKKGKYDLSNELILDAIEKFKIKNKYYKPPPSTLISNCYNNLGTNYYHQKDYTNSLSYFNKAYHLGLQNNQISIISRASEGIARIWDIQGNIDSAYHYFRIFKTYSDSLMNEENIKKIALMNARFKFEQDLNAERQERLREKQKIRANYLWLALVISSLLLVVVSLLLWLKTWRTKLKHSKTEQIVLKDKLEIRNKELTTHVMYQVRKNEFILNIIKKLRENVYKLKAENRDFLEEIIHDLEHNADNNAWKDFEVRFHGVHADFNKNLLDKFPDLTANELRLCAFLRLNMNTKEIATITYQTVNSIDTARSRLRHKFGLSKEDNLISFLTQI